MMGVPVSASAILMRKKGLLSRHFAETAGYLFQSEEDSFNPGLRSIQCGRRNDALKCWMAFQSLGRTGYARRVERQFELARRAADSVKQHRDLELVLEPESINVCFRMRGRSARRICEELDRRGIAKVGWGSFRDREFIRLVCVNPGLSESDLESLLDTIVEIGNELPPE
jgi:sulfinoalanine decarboxylase